MLSALRIFARNKPINQSAKLFNLTATLTNINNSNVLFRNTNRFYASESKVLQLIDAVRSKDTTAIARMAKLTPKLIVEQTSNDNTALHEAAKVGDVKMIELLSKEFSKEFNVNHKCHCHLKRTPLHYAAEGGHIDAVNKLFNLGADPNIEDEKGRTALDYALEKNHDELAMAIYKQGGKAKTMQGMSEQIVPRVGAKLFAVKFNQSHAKTSSTTLEKSFEDFISHLKNTNSFKK